jgi:hypothetical protein
MSFSGAGPALKEHFDHVLAEKRGALFQNA